MKQQKASTVIILAVMGLLDLAALIALAMGLETSFLSSVCMLIALAFSALYGFALFREPHGNLLKYTMLLFSFASIVSLISVISAMAYPHTIYAAALASCCVCYGAGRLNRIDKNKILFPVIDLIYLAVSVIWIVQFPSASIDMILRFLSMPIAFTTLMIAYFIRFREHKEAGEEK